MNVHEVPFDKLNITNRDVLREMGYGIKDADSFVEQQIDLLLDDPASLVMSRFVYRIYSGKVEREVIWIGDTLLNVGSIISSIMEEMCIRDSYGAADHQIGLAKAPYKE